MTIEKLNLGNLKNSDHFTFMEESVNATTLYPYIAQTFPTQVSELKDAFDVENEAYFKGTWSEITDAIQKAQNCRILRFREINNLLKGAELCEEKATAEAAEFLLKIMKDYGGASKILKLRVDSLSGVLTNLIEDYQVKFADKVEATGIAECLEQLKVANDLYKSLVTQRDEAHSEKIKSEMLKARNACDENWRGLVDAVNWRYYYEKDAQLVPYINFMNVLVGRFRHYTGQKPSVGGGSGAEGEEEVVYKYATFEFANGIKQSIPFAVGGPIVAPANTPGYEWKPQIPEKMPKTNKTFREVQIDSVKYTATFHFLDHREEEIEAVAGAELIAPENTTGCVWEPTVPATMPAEDTTYNEVLAPNNEQEEDDGQRTVTFTFINGETEVVKGEPGEALTYPTNTAGYIWSTSDSNPSKIPAQNFRVIEVPDNVPLFTIVWFSDPTTPIQWFMLPVGHEVPAAPAAPAGDPWSVSVSVMPDHNLYILPESMAEEEEE